MNHLSHVYCCNGPLLNLRMPFTNEIVCFRYFIQHLNVSKTLWTYSVHRDHFSEIIFLGLILGKDLVQSCLPPPLPPAWYHPPPAIEQLKSASVLYIHSSYVPVMLKLLSSRPQQQTVQVSHNLCNIHFREWRECSFPGIPVRIS